MTWRGELNINLLNYYGNEALQSISFVLDWLLQQSHIMSQYPSLDAIAELYSSLLVSVVNILHDRLKLL